MADTQPLALSHTRLQTWRRCPKQYEYKYVRGLNPKAKALPLERGTWLHSLFEAWYTTGDWETVHQRMAEEFEALLFEEKEHLGNMPHDCATILRNYVAAYGEQDAELKVIAVEQELEEKIPTGDTFKGVIDMIVEYPDGSKWIWDHKTVGSFMEEDFLMLDAQLARYLWLARKAGHDCDGIMFNEVITKPMTPPAMLASGKLSKRSDQFCDAATYIEMVKHYGLDQADYQEHIDLLAAKEEGRFFRRTHLSKSPGLVKTLMTDLVYSAQEIHQATAKDRYPRSTEKGCTWCPFQAVCQQELLGYDASDLIRLKFTDRSQR